MSASPTSYRQLIKENRNFRLLWLATLISLFGDWFNTITLYAMVTALTGSPLAVGLVEFLKLGGFALASLPAGLLADRIDRRRLMIACDLGRAALMPCFLLIGTAADLPFLYLLIVLQIGLGAIFDPAYRALLPNLVSDEALLPANAILAATWSSILAVGAALGGFITVALGSDAVFVINSLTYLGSAACLLALHHSPAQNPTPHALSWSRLQPTRLVALALADLRDGLRYLRHHRLILRLSLAKSSWALGGSALVYFLTQLGPRLTPRDIALGIGILYSFRGLGSGIGPLLARRYLPRSTWAFAMGALVALSGASYLTLAFLPQTFIILIPITLAHAASGAAWVLSTVLLQEAVPDAMRGRVFSAEIMVLTTIEAAVVLAAAALLEAGVTPLPLAIGAFAALQLSAGLGYTRWLTGSLRPRALEALHPK